MAIKPDIFLFITLTSGVSIIIIGLIIVLHCPLHVLSCSWWCHKIGILYGHISQRRKSKVISFQNTAANSSFINIRGKKYGVSLVDGRPQGHGFYTAGPWTSSTDTTSTTLSTTAENLQSIAFMGLVGGSEYYSVMTNSAGPATVHNNSSTATNTNTNPFSSIFPHSGYSDASYLGYHGVDNSNTLKTLSLGNHQTCNSEGFSPSQASNNTGVNPAILPTTTTSLDPAAGSADLHHVNDSLYDVDGGDDDMDADMMIMM